MMKNKKSLYILLAAILIRLLLNFTPSYKIDMNGYVAWSLYLAENGFKAFYETFHVVYGPVYLYLLWISGKFSTALASVLAVNKFFIAELGVKFWSTLFDFIGGWVIFKSPSKKVSLKFIFALIYILNPAIIMNSSIWGQFDTIPTTLLLGTLTLFLNEKIVASLILFGVAVLTKPQAAFFIPTLAMMIISKKNELLKFATLSKIFVIGTATYAALTLPFKFDKSFFWIIPHYLKSGGDYPYATANGFNLWTLLHGQVEKDSTIFYLGLTYSNYGLFFTLAALIFIFYTFKNSYKKQIDDIHKIFYSSYAAFFSLFSIFFLSTRMHERYLFPALIFQTLATLYSRSVLHKINLSLLSFCVFSNQAYIYWLSRSDIFWASPDDKFGLFISILTGISYILSIIAATRV